MNANGSMLKVHRCRIEMAEARNGEPKEKDFLANVLAEFHGTLMHVIGEGKTELAALKEAFCKVIHPQAVDCEGRVNTVYSEDKGIIFEVFITVLRKEESYTTSKISESVLMATCDAFINSMCSMFSK